MRKVMTAKGRSLLAAYVYQHTCSFAALSLLPLLPLVRSELGLSASKAGLLIFTLYLTTAVAAPLSGFFTDRIKEKFLVVFSIGLLSLGLVLVSFAKDFIVVVAVVLAMGLGYSISGPLSTKMVIVAFEDSERATALGIKQTGTSSGSALASLVLPSIAVAFHPHLAFMAAAVIASASIPLIIQNYVPVNELRRDGKERYVFRAMFNGGTVMFLLGSFGLGFAMFAMLTHLPLFLTSYVGLTVVEAGFMLALIQLFSFFGRIGLGVLVDRFFRKTRVAALFFASLIAAAASTVFLLSVSSQIWVATASLAFLGFFLFGSIGIVFTVGSELFDVEHVGVASGLTYFFLALGNAFGPFVFGQVADIGGYWSAWRLYVLIAYLLSLTFLFAWLSKMKQNNLFR